MRHRIAILILLAGALSAPVGLHGQAPGIPLRNAGVSRGLALAADAGFPGEASGLGTSFGASAAVGLGLVGLGATVTRLDVTGQDAVIAAGATANLRLIGGPLVPFSATLQGGVGRWTLQAGGQDLTTTSLTAGLGLAWTIASPVVSFKPWLAPRMHWNRAGDPAVTSSDPAVSGGIDLGFINGLSIRGMYDRILSDGPDAGVWSIGLGYALRVLR